MANEKKVTAKPKADEQTLPEQNATFPQQDEQPKTEQKPDEPKPEQPKEMTIEDFQKAVTEASGEITKATLAGNFDKITELTAKLQTANKALNAFKDKINAEKAAKIAEETRSRNIEFIAEKFGVSRETIEELIKTDSADPNTPLRVAMVNVFGGKIVQAKMGETGTHLVNKTNGGERGGKSKEIIDFLKTGTVTKQALLDRYPTEGKPEKLNGTARTVLSNGGWKLNDSGVYVQ